MGATGCAMKRLAALALALAAAATSVQPASALTCANEWGGDTFAGAQQAVAHPARWDGLMVGTIASVERRDDHWRTRVLVVDPGVVFSGEFRDTMRVEVGGNGPEMGFTEGAVYFLALTPGGDRSTTAWFVHPCGPNMEITSGDQLAQLRAISDSEVVVSEPAITGPPTALWIVMAAGLVAIAAMRLLRRGRSPLPALS